MTRPLAIRRNFRGSFISPRRNALTVLALLLAVALVLVQALGAMHTLLHDHARLAPHGHTTVVAPANDGGGASWVKALFDGHDSQADCDHYDHMTHADLAGVDVPVFAGVPAEGGTIACHPGWHLARQAAGFLARGPPTAV